MIQLSSYREEASQDHDDRDMMMLKIVNSGGSRI